MPASGDLDHSPNFPLNAGTPGPQELVVGERGPTYQDTELQATHFPFLRGSPPPRTRGHMLGVMRPQMERKG